MATRTASISTSFRSPCGRATYFSLPGQRKIRKRPKGERKPSPFNGQPSPAESESSIELDKRMASHFRRLRQRHERKHRRREIAQRTVRKFRLAADIDERHRPHRV